MEETATNAWKVTTFNRTIVELKLNAAKIAMGMRTSFNRTIVELKQKKSRWNERVPPALFIDHYRIVLDLQYYGFLYT